ncbi:MAG: sorbosone dehydrogenase family protein [Vicinamibacterales bacterium]
MGWDQRAESQDALSALTFFMYVDDVRQLLGEASCSPLSGQQIAECSARLPPMSPGLHSVSMVAVDGEGRESLRSTTYQVNVVPGANATAGVVSGAAAPEPPVGASADAAAAAVGRRIVATGLREPTDLATTPSGSVLVAERAGTVRLVRDGTDAALPILSLDDVALDTGGLLGLAVDPDYARTGFVYVVYTAADGYRVARYQHANDRLVDRVVLLDGVAAGAGATAALRFGPDGRLYVAFGAERDERLAADAAAYNGKVLRLNADGTVPDDQAGFTPVYASNVIAPRGLAWMPDARALWIAAGQDGSGVLNVVRQEGERLRRGRLAARYATPEAQAPAGALVYHGDSFKEWQGDLLVVLPAEGQVLRVRIDPADPARVLSTETVVGGLGGGARALAAAPDGTLYVAGGDSLMALSPSTLPSHAPELQVGR